MLNLVYILVKLPDVSGPSLGEAGRYKKTDPGVFHIKRKMKEQETKNFWVDENDMLWFKDWLVVPKDRELRNQIISEAHSSKLSIHPGSSKMYHDLKPHFWWTKMKKEMVALCG